MYIQPSGDGKLVTDYGEVTVRQGESNEQAAYRRYRAWSAGYPYEGYVKPYFWLGSQADIEDDGFITVHPKL